MEPPAIEFIYKELPPMLNKCYKMERSGEKLTVNRPSKNKKINAEKNLTLLCTIITDKEK